MTLNEGGNPKWTATERLCRQDQWLALVRADLDPSADDPPND